MAKTTKNLTAGNYTFIQSMNGAISIKLSEGFEINLTKKQVLKLPFDFRQIENFETIYFNKYYKL